MKKMILLVAAAMMLAVTAQAQTAKELAKEQKELNEINRKLLNQKPTRDAKKQAKELKKQGWVVPAGELTIEQQLTNSQLYAAELMADENGAPTKRFIQQTAITTSGSYNAGYAAARANAQVELAALLETEIVSAMQSKLDNAQTSAITAVTVDKFNQRTKAIVDQALTNAIPCVKIYRRLPNNNIEVQVRIAFDKKELAARLKRNMQKELEEEGDELNDIVDDILSSKF